MCRRREVASSVPVNVSLADAERELSLAGAPFEPHVTDTEDSFSDSLNDHDSSPGRFFGLMMSPCVSPARPPSSEVSLVDNANAEPCDLFHQQSSKRGIRVPRMGYWIHQWHLRHLQRAGTKFVAGSSSGRPGTGHYRVVHPTGCVLQGGADKKSAHVGLVPPGTQFEVLQTSMLEDGTVRGRIAAKCAHSGGWLSLGARFVERLEEHQQLQIDTSVVSTSSKVLAVAKPLLNRRPPPLNVRTIQSFASLPEVPPTPRKPPLVNRQSARELDKCCQQNL